MYPADIFCVAVGMGKTIMIASLVHTNRSLPEPSSSSPPPPSFKPNDQLLPGGPKEKSKPRQVRLQTAFKNHSNTKSVNDTLRPQQSTLKKIPSATLVVAPTSLLNQWAEELKRCSKEGTIEVHIWHGQHRFSLYEALYPDEVEYIDVDDEEEEIESHSDEEDEDVVMVDESESEGDDDGEWKPKGKSKKAAKVKPKKDTRKDTRKKIQVVVTSYGVLASEHAKYEKSVRISESSVFESTSAIPTCTPPTTNSHNQSNGSALFWTKPTTVSPVPARLPKRSVP